MIINEIIYITIPKEATIYNMDDLIYISKVSNATGHEVHTEYVLIINAS